MTSDAPLRRDVRHLGHLLGDVLAEQRGEEFLRTVERIRVLSRDVRASPEGKRRLELEASIRQIEPEVQATSCARSASTSSSRTSPSSTTGAAAKAGPRNDRREGVAGRGVRPPRRGGSYRGGARRGRREAVARARADCPPDVGDPSWRPGRHLGPASSNAADLGEMSAQAARDHPSLAGRRGAPARPRVSTRSARASGSSRRAFDRHEHARPCSRLARACARFELDRRRRDGSPVGGPETGRRSVARSGAILARYARGAELAARSPSRRSTRRLTRAPGLAGGRRSRPPRLPGRDRSAKRRRAVQAQALVHVAAPREHHRSRRRARLRVGGRAPRRPRPDRREPRAKRGAMLAGADRVGGAASIGFQCAVDDRARGLPSRRRAGPVLRRAASRRELATAGRVLGHGDRLGRRGRRRPALPSICHGWTVPLFERRRPAPLLRASPSRRSRPPAAARGGALGRAGRRLRRAVGDRGRRARRSPPPSAASS